MVFLFEYTRGVRRLGIVCLLVLGCRREPEKVQADPARPVTADRASPTTMPPPPATEPSKCHVGGLVAVDGRATEAVESITKAEIDDALCPQLADLRTCLAGLTKGELAFEALVTAKLTIDAGGALKVVLDGGTLKDDAMKTCVRDALLAASLPHGPGEGRYEVRITARKQ